MDWFWIYLLMILPEVFGGRAWAFLAFVTILGSVCVHVATMMSKMDKDIKPTQVEVVDRINREAKFAFGVSMGYLVIATLVPERDVMMMIAGGAYVSQLEGVGELAPNAVKLLNSLMDSGQAMMDAGGDVPE